MGNDEEETPDPRFAPGSLCENTSNDANPNKAASFPNKNSFLQLFTSAVAVINLSILFSLNTAI